MRNTLMLLSGLAITVLGLSLPSSGAELSPEKPLRDSLPAGWQLESTYFQTTPTDDRWWDTFNDPVLTALIKRAVDNNFDVLAAARRIDAASEVCRAAKAGYYPHDISERRLEPRANGRGCYRHSPRFTHRELFLVRSDDELGN